MYKDKDRQKEANRLAASRRRAKGMTKGMTNQGMTPANSNTLRPEPVKRTITDACGTEHAIDFAGRRKDYELLESWAEGSGTEQQQSMGKLARNYRYKLVPNSQSMSYAELKRRTAEAVKTYLGVA